ncbi:hypothetical protein [Microbacterium soli]|uniref:Uncharacterized protein n=1 Tax=Microbacterium soli TaxID=446075 RepID=A0ABP7NII9_9MICO
MGKNMRDPYLIVTKNFVVSDRRGRKYMAKMLNDEYEVVAEHKNALSRASTVTFRKTNPDYQG